MFDWQTLVAGLSSIYENSAKLRASARAREDLLAGQRAADAKQQLGNQLVSEQVGKLAQSSPAQPQASSLAQYTTALKNARVAPGASTVPNLGSGRYQAAVQNAGQRVAQYGSSQAYDLSQLAGAARQRESEGYARADLGANLRTLGEEGDMELYLAKLRAAREQPNPWAMMLAQLGQKIGRNYQPRQKKPLMAPGAGVRAAPYNPYDWQNLDLSGASPNTDMGGAGVLK